MVSPKKKRKRKCNFIPSSLRFCGDLPLSAGMAKRRFNFELSLPGFRSEPPP